MTIQRGLLISNNIAWNDKRRYKVNATVTYLGAVYQNKTGANSDPSTGVDWVKIAGAQSGIAAYAGEFLYNSANPQTFTLPAGVFINSVTVNRAPINPSEWSQSGTTLTIIRALKDGNTVAPAGISVT